MTAKRVCAALVATIAVALAGVSSGIAANNSNQTGLVNVSAGDVNLLNNANLAVAANVAANACGVAVPVAVLATQVIAGGQTVDCTALGGSGPLTITQSQNGPPVGSPNGGNNSNQSGLVNVSVGNVNVLNDLNAAIAANIAINVCGVTVPVAILAQQLAAGTTTVTCTANGQPILIQQA